jgi:hypothetical protein
MNFISFWHVSRVRGNFIKILTPSMTRPDHNRRRSLLLTEITDGSESSGQSSAETILPLVKYFGAPKGTLRGRLIN